MVLSQFDTTDFGSIVDQIFSLKDRQKSLDLIDKYDRFWTQMKSGSQGFSGNKAINASTMFNELFTIVNDDAEDVDDIIDSDDMMSKVLGE
jgi:hypothetical protein